MELKAKSRLLEAKPQATAQEAAAEIKKIFDIGGLGLKIEAEDDTSIMCEGKTKLGDVQFVIYLNSDKKGAKALDFDFLVKDGIELNMEGESIEDTPWGVLPHDIASVQKTIDQIEGFSSRVAKECDILAAWWRQFWLAMKKINQLTEMHK
jgi:hypothetical protein